MPLCKAMNIPLTTTVFTGDASQQCARKAGFEENYSMDYTELTNMGYDFSKCKVKSCKLMSLKV